MNRCWLISVVIALVLCSTISYKTAGKTDQGVQEGPQGESTVEASQLVEGMFAKIVTPRALLNRTMIFNRRDQEWKLPTKKKAAFCL